jgi:uncharacterized repeat protein (TIGR03837 family)
MPAMRVRWDIFCNVIDNYGDIGVAWRLARTLVCEQRQCVRLWVDDLRAFARIWPAIDAHAEAQIAEGVDIRHWTEPFPDAVPAEVVVEAFGCALPETYLAAMAGQSPPVWINLEYLSAEVWVSEHHGLPSPHPRLALTKYFYFPGYTPATGGLPGERELETQRDAFLQTGVAGFWPRFGLAPPQIGEWRISLFAYENPALPGLLDAWASGPQHVTCLVPEGRVIQQLRHWLDAPALAAGDVHQRGRLRVHVLPFTDQDAYDRLLWACDLNLVRGEDSCVRAQWAARPLVWQAYPQAEQAHHAKLDALLGLYVARLEPAAAQAVTGLWRVWNGMPGAPAVGDAWAAWRAQRQAIDTHARAWPQQLAAAGRLADRLVEFAENRLK